MPGTAGNDLKTLRALVPFLWNYRGRVLLALGFLVLAKVANVGVPLVLKDIVDSLDLKAGEQLLLPLSLLLVYGLLRLASSLFNELRDAVFARVRHGSMRSVLKPIDAARRPAADAPRKSDGDLSNVRFLKPSKPKRRGPNSGDQPRRRAG
jgi:hypothetical protein